MLPGSAPAEVNQLARERAVEEQIGEQIGFAGVLTLGQMSGTDLARRLRNDSSTSSTPILALTGHIDFADPDGLFLEVLGKPVRLDALTAAVERALRI